MDKRLALTSEIVVNKINKKLAESNITHAQYSSMCGVVESTLTKVLNGTSKRVGFDTLTPMAATFNISIDEALKEATEKLGDNVTDEIKAPPTTVPAKMLVSQEDKFLNLFIENHQRQVDDLKYQLKVKDRWIKTLAALIIVCTAVFAAIALFALTHPDIALIRTTAQAFHGITL